MSLDIDLSIEVDTGGKTPKVIDLYETNITHNLGAMAEAAGIYKHLWRPEEIGLTTAGELIKPLREGLKKLVDEPKAFEKYNSPNGWGMYEHFVPFVREYLEACEEHPKATIDGSRKRG